MFWRNSKFSKTFSSIWDHSTIFDPKLVHIFPPHRITRPRSRGTPTKSPHDGCGRRAEDVRKPCGRRAEDMARNHGLTYSLKMDAAWFKHDAIMLHLSAMDFLWTLQGPSLSKSSFILHLMFVFIAKSVSSSHLKPSSMFSQSSELQRLGTEILRCLRIASVAYTTCSSFQLGLGQQHWSQNIPIWRRWPVIPQGLVG